MKRMTVRDIDGSANFITEIGTVYSAPELRLATVQVLLDRLSDYEDAEERGELVRLPCKVGDTFWWIERLVGDDKPFIRSGQVSEIGISDAITIYEYDGRDFSIEDVYFTREEAESALAEENFFIE